MATGRMVSVSMGEKGKQKEYRGRQITLWPDKLNKLEPMQLAFALVRIIYDTITSVLFWA